MPGTVSRANCPAANSMGCSSSTSKASTSWVSGRLRRTTPVSARGAGAKASLNGAPTSSTQSSWATLWHINSSPSPLRYRWPGASAHSVVVRPLARRALHVPHVPVPHSYGSSTPLRRPASRIFSPVAHSKSRVPLRALTTTFIAARPSRLALGVPDVDLRDLLVALVQRLGGFPVLDEHALDHLGDDVRVQHLAGRRRRRAGEADRHPRLRHLDEVGEGRLLLPERAVEESLVHRRPP